jgi:hypothetical protein
LRTSARRRAAKTLGVNDDAHLLPARANRKSPRPEIIGGFAHAKIYVGDDGSAGEGREVGDFAIANLPPFYGM